MKQVVEVLGIALAFSFIASTQVTAQDSDRSWAVWKLSLKFTDKDELYKRNLTKAEAQKLAYDLNENNKEWTKYTYHAQQSKEDESTAIRPGRIEMPKLGFIDPGRPKIDAKKVPSKTDAKKVPSLAGKTGKGKIGKATVTFKFQGKENSGIVTIRGDLTAEGKWEETGTGAVYIKIPNSVLRGGTDGKKAAGLRFSEDKTQPLTNWSIAFDENASEEKSYSVEARFLNGFSGYGPAYPGYTAKKGPYTLEGARAVLKEVEAKMGADETKRKFEIRIINKSGKVIVEVKR